jgi:hypothetical protein
MTRRSRRDPYSRTVVRLPERDLAESILDLAAPLLQPLGATAAPDEARCVIEVAINLWNAHRYGGHHDIAVLVFRPAGVEAST